LECWIELGLWALNELEWELVSPLGFAGIGDDIVEETGIGAENGCDEI
jgi:hypothetical protein